MNIFINCSNLKKGGGLQVADSICRDLRRFGQHRFVVVLSKYLIQTANAIQDYPNVKVLNYDSNNGWKVLLTGRDEYLDTIVDNYNIDVVLSIFGPISWMPKCPHLCGFARSHLVLNDSPYFKRMALKPKMRSFFFNRVLAYFFKRGVDAFYTENKYISDKWQMAAKKQKVYTVTNYYNQVYDQPELWKEKQLPHFRGITLLCVTANYDHKNLEIAIDTAKNLLRADPSFNFRFVFTIDENQYPELPEKLKPHFVFTGRVDICECPSLYQQADIMFQPTLLECFTATYPEAMRMEVPIVTTDLEFAHGLCGDAAVYYSPLDAQEAANAIYKVATDNRLKEQLILKGKNQLKTFDTYSQRTEKLISIVEQLIK